MEYYKITHSARAGVWALGIPIIVSLIASIIVFALGDAETIINNTYFTLFTSVAVELGFVMVAFFLGKKDQIKCLNACGIKAKSPWWYYVVAILLGVICLFLFNPLIELWERLLTTIGYNITEINIPLSNVWYLLLALVCLAVVPAFCEEMLFRGVILNGLRSYGACFSIGISALLFSLMHTNLQQLPYTLILGVVLGIIVYFTRDLKLSMLIHFSNNAVAVLLMYFTRSSGNPFVWYDILIALVGVIGAVALMILIIYYLKKKSPIPQEAQGVEQILDKTARNKMMSLPVLLGVFILIIFSLNKFGVL